MWKTKLRNAVNLFAPDLKPILAGADSAADPEPDEGDRAKWDQASGRLFSLLFFVNSGSAHATVLTHEETVDGTAAWKALNERLDAHTQEARRACHRELFWPSVPGGRGYYRSLPERNGSQDSPPGLGGGGLQEGLPRHHALGPDEGPRFTFIREMHYRDEIHVLRLSPGDSQRFYVDQHSRNASGPWSRAEGPRWRGPHPTSSIDARRTDISSVTAPNKCR